MRKTYEEYEEFISLKMEDLGFLRETLASSTIILKKLSQKMQKSE